MDAKHQKARDLFNTEPVKLEDMQEGDFIRCGGWSRPRLVVHADENAQGNVVFLADPDDRFDSVHRRLDRDEYDQRGGDGSWLRLPNLRKLWEENQG